ncbi:MAG TPA: helix-turn-helix transcriptional regulator [Thermoanaerobaculia bacterium]|nr:helix-turn-helix transcriptional regulator [Thermoanaerobaculia bacterium]
MAPVIHEHHPGVSHVRESLKRMLRDSSRTYAEVAADLGISLSNLSSILNGNQYLRVEHVFQICEAAGRAPADFFANLYPPSPGDGRLVGGVPLPEIRELIRELVREVHSEEVGERVAGGGR